MASTSVSLSSFFSIFSIICSTNHLLLISSVEAESGGFSVEFIHRDSPKSPFFNPLQTQFDRFKSAFHRSISRAMRFNPTLVSKDVQSDIVPGGGEYLMRFSIGTPPLETLGIADTGSDLTWTQCKPCEQCYEQKSPLYDPNQSSSYQSLTCESSSCNALEDAARQCYGLSQSTCEYTYQYGDRSFTRGNLAVEKLTLSSTDGPPVSLKKIVFGCGHNNGGTFDEVGSGIIGLGGGSLSLISQLGESISGKFSYCLVSIESNVTSNINFGDKAAVLGPDIASTPLVNKLEAKTFYYLTLEAVSVGDKRLPYLYSPNVGFGTDDEGGNIIIDSGTTLTFLRSDFFDVLVPALEEAINAERVSDPKGMLNVCFKADKEIEFPIITFHFTGADVKLQPLNTFAHVEDDLICFTMIPSNDVAIYGNLAQMNFLVGYDLENKALSFLPTDCSKQ